jgi:hypothetical protein
MIRSCAFFEASLLSDCLLLPIMLSDSLECIGDSLEFPLNPSPEEDLVDRLVRWLAALLIGKADKTNLSHSW